MAARSIETLEDGELAVEHESETETTRSRSYDASAHSRSQSVELSTHSTKG
jgi:hypothetical protein